MAVQTPKKASREDWHPARILAVLHMRGITLRELAKQHGLASGSTLSRAMLHSSPLCEQRLADAAGVPVQEMFGARYHADGTPKGRGIRGARILHCKDSYCQHNGNNTLRSNHHENEF